MSRPTRDINGILLLDKPCGMTSNAALQRVKRIAGARKAGHTGSLDPLATGMLAICFGQATKISPFLLEADKAYRVTARFGVQTDTGDADGAVVRELPGWTPGRTELEAVLPEFTGEILQVPPMYSALKHGGRRLYELARAGEHVERSARPIKISALGLELYSGATAVFYVHCGKGTYIRTLVEDLASRLGGCGHVTALRRLWVAPFEESQMQTLEAVAAALEPGGRGLEALLIPPDSGIDGCPAVELTAAEAFYLLQGQQVNAGRDAAPGLARLYDPSGRFLGVGEVLAEGRVAPRRLFVASSGRPPA